MQGFRGAGVQGCRVQELACTLLLVHGTHPALGLQDVGVPYLEALAAAAHLRGGLTHGRQVAGDTHLEHVVVADDHDGDVGGLLALLRPVDDLALLLDEVALPYEDGPGLGDDPGLGVDHGARPDGHLAHREQVTGDTRWKLAGQTRSAPTSPLSSHSLQTTAPAAMVTLPLLLI